MNRVFKVLWSHTLGKWVVTSELGRSRKKAKRTQLATTVATAVMIGAMSVAGAQIFIDGDEVATPDGDSSRYYFDEYKSGDSFTIESLVLKGEKLTPMAIYDDYQDDNGVIEKIEVIGSGAVNITGLDLEHPPASPEDVEKNGRLEIGEVIIKSEKEGGGSSVALSYLDQLKVGDIKAKPEDAHVDIQLYMIDNLQVGDLNVKFKSSNNAGALNLAIIEEGAIGNIKVLGQGSLFDGITLANLSVGENLTLQDDADFYITSSELDIANEINIKDSDLTLQKNNELTDFYEDIKSSSSSIVNAIGLTATESSLVEILEQSQLEIKENLGLSNSTLNVTDKSKVSSKNFKADNSEIKVSGEATLSWEKADFISSKLNIENDTFIVDGETNLTNSSVQANEITFAGGGSIEVTDEELDVEPLEVGTLNIENKKFVIKGLGEEGLYLNVDNVNVGEKGHLHLGGNLQLIFDDEGSVDDIDEGSTFVYIGGNLSNTGALSGSGMIEGTVTNNGNIYIGNAFAHANSATTKQRSGDTPQFGTLLVGGYSGEEGSVLHFGTELNGDESKHDQLIIEGDAKGESVIVVHPVGDVLKDSTEEGIHLVQMDMDSSDLELDLDDIVDGYTFDTWELEDKKDGWFLQYAGAEEQEVVDPTDPEQPGGGTEGGDKPGTGSKPSTDPVVRTEANAYLANLVMANDMFTMRYHDRLYAPKEDGVWAQVNASFGKFKSNLTGDISSKTDYYTLRLGKDLISTDEYVMGIMAAYGHSTGKTENNRHDVRKTDHSSDAFAVGVYGSYTFAPHSYVDAWAQYVHARNKVEWGTKHFDYTEKYNAKGVLLSLEAAYGVNIADSVYFQPQGQITYMGVKADTHKDARGREFGSNRGNVQLRLGARFFGENVFANGQGSPYVEANYIHNTKAYKVKMQAVSGGVTDLELDGAKNLFQLKVGSDFNLNNNSKIGAHVSHTFGKKSYRDTQLNVDFRYNF